MSLSNYTERILLRVESLLRLYLHSVGRSVQHFF